MGALEDEVILYLDLMKMAKLAYFAPLDDVVVDIYPKTRTNPRLPKGDSKSIHPMSKHVRSLNSKAIPQLQKVLQVECHLAT